MTITKEKIAELRAVSYAATPTPWRVQTDAIGGIHKGTVNIEECGRAIETVATYCGAYEGHGKSNADFIVAAVNALPELLDEIERLQKDNGDLVCEKVDVARALYEPGGEDIPDSVYISIRLIDQAVAVRRLADTNAKVKSAWEGLYNERNRLWREEADRVGAVKLLLEANGCDCECDHHDSEHDDECERCLACRISWAVK